MLVENIWRKISLFLGIKITCTNLTLCFYNEINTKTTILLSFICFKIYKYKMEYRFIRKNMLIMSRKIKVKNYLCLQPSILRKACLRMMK